MLTYALWFFGGVLAHKLFSHLINIGHSRITFDSAIDSIILVVDALSSDVEFALKLKQDHLMHSNISDELLDKCIQSDKKVLLHWQNTIIIKMASVASQVNGFRSKYENWPDAKKRVEELRKQKGT